MGTEFELIPSNTVKIYGKGNYEKEPLERTHFLQEIFCFYGILT